MIGLIVVVEEGGRCGPLVSGILQIPGQAALVSPLDEGGGKARPGRLGLGKPDLEVGLGQGPQVEVTVVEPLHELDRSSDLAAVGVGGFVCVPAASGASAGIADDEPLGERSNDFRVCGGQVLGCGTEPQLQLDEILLSRRQGPSVDEQFPDIARGRFLRQIIEKGAVTLLGAWVSDGASGRGRGRFSGRCSGRGGPAGSAGGLVPDGEADGHLGSVAGGGHQVAAGPEVGWDAAERGQEPLRSADGAKSPSSRVRVAASADDCSLTGCSGTSRCGAPLPA